LDDPCSIPGPRPVPFSLADLERLRDETRESMARARTDLDLIEAQILVARLRLEGRRVRMPVEPGPSERVCATEV
jgi:hypothetical protein